MKILTGAGGSLPLQTLSIGEGDDVGVGVHAALGAAAPHALHAIARAVGAACPQRARLLAGPGILVGTDWNGITNILSFRTQVQISFFFHHLFH